MFNICIHSIVFQLCLMKWKRERKKMNEVEMFMFGFFKSDEGY